MTQDDLPDLAALWKEQIDPAEEAELRALASQTLRNARLRRYRDFAFGLLAFTFILNAWLNFQLSKVMQVAILLSFLFVVWSTVHRYRIAVAALAPPEEPGDFLGAAIKDARAELGYSGIQLLFGIPIFGMWIALILYESPDWLQKIYPAAGLVLGAALIYLPFARGYFVIRARLRRLEAMAAEPVEE